MVKSIIILILTAVLILSLLLISRFSYDTFIPFDFGFGLNLYWVFLILLLLIGELLLMGRDKFSLPLFLVTTNTIVFFAILYYFEPGPSAGHGGGYGLLFLYYYIGITAGLFIYAILRTKIKTPTIKKSELLDTFVNKYFGGISSVFILLIVSINAYSLYDYSTYGLHYKLSNKSNVNAIIKSASELNDISRCELLNSNNDNDIVNRCFRESIEKTLNIKEFNEGTKLTESQIHHFYSVTSSIRNAQCTKTNHEEKCKEILLAKTYPILMKALGKYYLKVNTDITGIYNYHPYAITKVKPNFKTVSQDPKHFIITSIVVTKEEIMKRLQLLPSVVSVKRGFGFQKLNKYNKFYKHEHSFSDDVHMFHTEITVDILKLTKRQKDFNEILKWQDLFNQPKNLKRVKKVKRPVLKYKNSSNLYGPLIQIEKKNFYWELKQP